MLSFGASSKWTALMGSITRNPTAQALASYSLGIDSGETATVRVSKVINWEKGLGWAVFPGSGGELSVEYSLRAEGDAWVPHSSSPFTEKDGDSEPGAFERIRFAASSAAGEVDILVPVIGSGGVEIEIA